MPRTVFTDAEKSTVVHMLDLITKYEGARNRTPDYLKDIDQG